jgi:hypothetical protein
MYLVIRIGLESVWIEIVTNADDSVMWHCPYMFGDDFLGKLSTSTPIPNHM